MVSRSAAGNLGSITRQQEHTTQLATAMTEMTSMVHEVAHNTVQVAEEIATPRQIASGHQAENQHKHDEAEALYREIEQNSERVVGGIDQLMMQMTSAERL